MHLTTPPFYFDDFSYYYNIFCIVVLSMVVIQDPSLELSNGVFYVDNIVLGEIFNLSLTTDCCSLPIESSLIVFALYVQKIWLVKNIFCIYVHLIFRTKLESY